MKNYTTERYQITIFSEPTFMENSADNINNYDLVYFDKSEYVLPTVFGIKIFNINKLLKSAVIGSVGGGTGIHETSTIVEDDRLLICSSDSIFCLSIPELSLLWKTKADQATCFEIFKHKDDYIVHGELEISRLDKNGNIVWQQGGRDIFTTLDGKDDFAITDEYILATDWENRKYKFDFNGKIIL
ncbi:hypothetical protein [Chryseobacterium foetidum]|uniref:hypothetical protein n=1 Tax=Chryseobacterium foetidum TaxID=2951057 RepID=UPI0021C5B0AF|nr:hypothetical protein [Chryseobacterium foetidum]